MKKGIAVILVGLLVMVTLPVIGEAGDKEIMRELLEKKYVEYSAFGDHEGAKLTWLIPEYFPLIVNQLEEIYKKVYGLSFREERFTFDFKDNIYFLIELSIKNDFSPSEFWQNCYLEIEEEKYKPTDICDLCSSGLTREGLIVKGILTFKKIDIEYKKGNPLLEKELDNLKLIFEKSEYPIFSWNPKKIYRVINALSEEEISHKEKNIEDNKEISQIKGPVAGRGILRSEEPTYPEWAEKQGARGKVVLKFWVLPNGEVSNIELQRTSGWSELDECAVKALKKWKFEPIKKKNVQWGEIPFKFETTGQKLETEGIPYEGEMIEYKKEAFSPLHPVSSKLFTTVGKGKDKSYLEVVRKRSTGKASRTEYLFEKELSFPSLSPSLEKKASHLPPSPFLKESLSYLKSKAPSALPAISFKLPSLSFSWEPFIPKVKTEVPSLFPSKPSEKEISSPSLSFSLKKRIFYVPPCPILKKSLSFPDIEKEASLEGPLPVYSEWAVGK